MHLLMPTAELHIDTYGRAACVDSQVYMSMAPSAA